MQKSFKDSNPALAFISVSKVKADHPDRNEDFPPEGYKMNPKYVETKSRRFGLLLQPSVFSSLKELADKKHISVNEIIGNAIDRYLKESN